MFTEGNDGGDGWKVAVAAICTFLGMSALIVLIALVYGYRNPESSIGQFIIRVRSRATENVLCDLHTKYVLYSL